MSLLTLPTELRHEIYSYLTTSERTVCPFGHISIAAISHKPPPSNLQCACRFLCHDVMAYFYTIATIRITPEHFDASCRKNAPSAAAVRRARSVEIVMYWYDFVSGSWSFHMTYEMSMIRASNREAKYLKRLVLTLGDNTYHMGCKEKEKRLAQLKEVKDGVTFVVGMVDAVCSHDTDELRMRVEKYVRELNADYA